MPLTTKKTGMKNPNPSPCSLASTSSASRSLDPAANSRVTIPAANAPRRMSRPSSSAIQTMNPTNSTTSRTAS